MGKTYTIDEARLYKVFKKMVDYKFEELSINKAPLWIPKNDDFELVDRQNNILIIHANNRFLISRRFYWSFLEYLPLSYKQVNELFTKYLNERYPSIKFQTVTEFD